MGRKRNGTAFPSEGGFTIQITTNDGKRPKRTLPAFREGKAVTLAVARKVARDCQTLYDKGFPVPLFGLNQEKPKEAPTVLEYFKKWHASQSYPSVADEFSIIKNHIDPAKIAQLRMGQVTKSDVREWVAWLKQRTTRYNKELTLSPKYLNKIYNLLSRVFGAGAEYDDYYNPFAELRPRKLLPAPLERELGQDRTYPRAAVVSLLSDPKVRDDRKMLYAIYFLAGLRANEALATRFRNYDTSKAPLGRLIIAKAFRKKEEVSTKTKATRFVPVHPVLAAMLADWKNSGFESRYGRKPGPDDFMVPNPDLTPKTRRETYEAFKLDCKRLGITPKRLHDTRHTFISMALDDGADSDSLKRITHTSPRATAFDLYNHANWERLCRAMNALKIELPTKEQKTMENALNNAPLGGNVSQVAENTDGSLSSAAGVHL